MKAGKTSNVIPSVKVTTNDLTVSPQRGRVIGLLHGCPYGLKKRGLTIGLVSMIFSLDTA